MQLQVKFIAVSYDRELKQRRRQRHRQREKTMIWLVECGKNNRAARAARTLVEFSEVVCQTTTWNFQI